MKPFILFLMVALNLCSLTFAQMTGKPFRPNQIFEGIVKTIVTEDKTGTRRHFLDTGEQSYPLILEDENLRNRKVSITGRLNRENAVVIEKVKILQPAETDAEATVSGIRRVLVLLLNFQNHTAQPATVSAVRQRIFLNPKSPKQYYLESSEGRLRLEGGQQAAGDVYGYFTLPFTDENCSTDTVYNVWRRAADKLARGSGIEPNMYQSVIYLFAAPAPGCKDFPVFADLGTIGGQTTERVFFTNAFNDFDNPQNDYFDYAVTHEIGHTLGLNHVSGYTDCPTNVPFESCGFAEYADRTDVMGSFNRHLLCNYQRLRLGWLNGKVKQFDSPGVYYLRLNSPNKITKSVTAAQIRLKHPDGNFLGQSLYLEYRHNRPPFDLFREDLTTLPTARFADQGVSIRAGNENLQQRISRFFMIDTTPETQDFGDAPLLPGQSYFQSYYGIRITTLGVNPWFGASIKIEIGGIQPSASTAEEKHK